MAGRFRRFGVVGLVGLGGVAALALLGAAGGLVWLAGDAGNEWVRGLAESEGSAATAGGRVRIGGLEWNLFSALSVTDLALEDASGRVLFSADELTLRYDLRGLHRRAVVVEELRLVGPAVDMGVDERGVMDIGALFGADDDAPEEPPEPATQWQGLDWDVSVQRAALVGGSVRWRDVSDPAAPLDVSIPGLSLSFGGGVNGRRVSLSALQIDADLDSPVDLDLGLQGGVVYDSGAVDVDALRLRTGGTLVTLDGSIARVETDPALALKISVSPLAAADLEAIVGSPVLLQDVQLAGELRGPMRDLHADLRVDAPAGKATLGAWVDLATDPLPWRLAVDSDGLAVHELVAGLGEPVDVRGSWRLEGVGTDWPAGIDATFVGDAGPQVIWGEPIAELQLAGRLAGGEVHLERVGLTHAVGRLDADGTIDLVGEQATVQARLRVPQLAALRRYGVADTSGSVGFDGLIRAGWAADKPLDVFADGRLRARDLSVAGATLGEGSGPATVHLVGEAVTGHGTLALIGIRAPGVGLDGLELDWTADYDPAKGGGAEADLRAVGVSIGDGAVKLATLEGHAGGGLDRAGAPFAQADLQMGALLFGPAEVPAEGGPVTLSYGGDRVEVGFDLSQRADTDAPEPVLADFLSGRLTGDLAAGSFVIDQLVVAPRSEWPLRASGPVRFRLVDGGVRDLWLDVQSPAGAVQARGDWLPDERGETDLHLTVDQLDLAKVADVIIRYSPPSEEPSPVEGLTGLASLTLDLRDQGEDFDVGLDVSLSRVSLPGVVQEISVDAAVLGPLRHPLIDARVSGRRSLLVALGGHVPLDADLTGAALDCARAVDLDLLIAPGALGRFGMTFPGLEMPEGVASAEVAVRGPACDPDIEALAAVSMPVGEGGERARLDLHLEREGDKLILRGAGETALVRRLAITGEAETQLDKVLAWALRGQESPPLDQGSTWVSAVDLSVAPLGVPIAALRPFMSIPDGVSGRLAGGVNVAGSPLRPVVQGAILWVDGEAGGIPIEQAMIGLVPDGGGYRLDADFSFGPEGGLHANGHLPVNINLDEDPDSWLSAPGLNLRINGRCSLPKVVRREEDAGDAAAEHDASAHGCGGIPLALVAGLVPGLEDAEGRLEVVGAIQGTLLEPRPQLAFSLADGGLAVDDMGLRYDDMALELTVVGDRIELGRFSMTAQPLRKGIVEGAAAINQRSRLDVKGSATMANGAPDKVELDVDADAFWLMATPSTRMRIEGALDVAGRWPALSVKGDVKLAEGRIVLDESAFLDDSNLALDPLLTVHRGNTGQVVSRAEEGPPLWQDFDVELALDLQRNLSLIAVVPTLGGGFSALSSVNLDAELDSQDLTIRIEDGVEKIHGNVDLLRGSLGVFGATFDISGNTGGDEAARLAFIGDDYANPVLDLRAERQAGQYGAVAVDVTGTVDEMRVSFSSEEYPDQTDVMSILLFGKPASELTDSEGQSGGQMLNAALAMAAGSQVQQLFGERFQGKVEIEQGAFRYGMPLNDKLFIQVARNGLAEEGQNIWSGSLEWLITRRLYAEMVTGDANQSSADLYWRWRF